MFIIKTKLIIQLLNQVLLCSIVPEGPYDIIFRRFYHCNDLGENTWLYSTKLSKINRTHLAYTANFTIPRGDNNDMMIRNSVHITLCKLFMVV